MKRLSWIIIPVLMSFVVCCGRKDENVTKIGAILALSGDWAPYGNSAKEGYLLALEEINENRNKNKISIVFEDSRGAAKEAVNAFSKLANIEKIPIVFGLLASSEVLAVAPLAEKSKTLLFSSGASSPLISDAGDYIFRDVPSDLLEATLMAETAYSKLGLKRVGIVHINNDYGNGVFEKFRSGFELLGGKLVSNMPYNPNQTDFKTHILKVMDIQPEAIYFIGYKELGKLVKQAKEIGLKGQYLSNALFEDPDVLNVAGAGAEGLIFSTFYFDVNSEEPRTKNFVNKYRDLYGKDPDGFVVAAYDAIHVVFDALGSKSITADNIKNSLYEMEEFNGLLGNFKFDQYGDVILPVKLKTVRDNKFVNY